MMTRVQGLARYYKADLKRREEEGEIELRSGEGGGSRAVTLSRYVRGFLI